MSITGGDSSLYQPGGTRPPDPQLFETTLAAKDAAKRMELNLVPDSQVLDAQIQQGMKYERHPATASHPTLQSPIFTLRELISSTADEAPEAYLEAYQSLRDLLPPELRAKFDAEMELRHSERSDETNALHRGLGFLAQLFIGLQAAAEPFAAGSAALYNSNVHMALPLAALQEVIVLGGEVLQEGMKHLKQQGTGSAFYDELLSSLKLAHTALKKLEGYKNQILEDKATDKTYKEIAEVSARISTLASEFEKRTPGPELTIIGPLMRAMALTAASQALPGGLKPLAIGFALASVGLYSENSKAGIIDRGMRAFLENSLAKIEIKDFNAAESALFSKLAETAIIGAMIGNGALMGIFQNDIGNENLMSAVFIGRAILNQGWISGIFPHESNEKIEDALEFLAVSLSAKSAEAKNKELAEAYFKANIQELGERIDAIDFGVFTTQAKLALKEENFDAYMAAFNGALKKMGISPDDFAAETHEFIKQMSSLYNYLTPEAMDDQTNTITGMTQI